MIVMANGQMLLKKPKPEERFRFQTFALVRDEYGKSYLAQIRSAERAEPKTSRSFAGLEEKKGVKIAYYRLEPEHLRVISGFDKALGYARTEMEKPVVSGAGTEKISGTEEMPPDRIPTIQPRKEIRKAEKEAEGVFNSITRILGKNKADTIEFFAGTSDEAKLKLMKIIIGKSKTVLFSFRNANNHYAMLAGAKREGLIQPTFEIVGEESLRLSAIPKKRI